jgi:DNA-binding HxlR family transcriptional regulator
MALAAPLNLEILTTLADSPRSASGLLGALGQPPRTTAHKRLRELAELGALQRRRQSEFPCEVSYELTPDGVRMLELARALGRWLAEEPKGGVSLGSPRAKRLIHTLVAGWNSSIISALAARPLSLTELNRLIDSVPYPSLERRVIALRESGLIQVARGGGRGTPYEATDWLRRAIAPLLAAATFEQRPGTAARLRADEVWAALLLAAPLARLGPGSEGTLVIAVYSQTAGLAPDRGGLTGITLQICEGRVEECLAEIDDAAPTWVLGSPDYWAEALLNGAIGRLRIGGETPQLGAEVVTGVHRRLADPERG